MGRIGLFGGTFDPVHSGHIALAKRVVNAFSLDRLIFIPAGNPPHKQNKHVTDAKHRVEMVRLATADEPKFSVSDYEVESETPNYSYLTISHFKEAFPDDEIFFLIGGDSFRNLPDWKNYRTLLTLCTFIVVPRPGVEKHEYLEKFHGDEVPPHALFLKDFAYDLSSTEVRETFVQGKDAGGKVPEAVLAYIQKNQLYQTGASHDD